ncbi:MAG: hypothetical protein JOY77_01600 [Alphaproteobacteria bacterium]|nr:hypothetical protein [Alphaproteobacteria bacterium]MBV9061606.1 hypothetical protein [Alphaproteobacteria bacterium]
MTTLHSAQNKNRQKFQTTAPGMNALGACRTHSPLPWSLIISAGRFTFSKLCKKPSVPRTSRYDRIRLTRIF